MRFFRKFKKFFRSFIQRVKVGASRTSKKVANNVKMVVEKVAAFGKKIVARVAKRTSVVTAPVVHFVKKVWTKVKAFAKKAKFKFCYFWSIWGSLLSVIISAVVGTFVAAALAVINPILALVGLICMFGLINYFANTILKAEGYIADVYSHAVEKNGSKIERAKNDPEFKAKWDALVAFDDEATLDSYSKRPKFFKFVQSKKFCAGAIGLFIVTAPLTLIGGTVGSVFGIINDCIGFGASGAIGLTYTFANRRRFKTSCGLTADVLNEIEPACARLDALAAAEKVKTDARAKDLQAAIDSGDYTMYNLKYGCKAGPAKNKKKK